MKILQISSAEFLGGGERHLVDLSNSLAARGHDVYAALRPRSPVAKQLSAIDRSHRLELPLRNSFDAYSARQLSAFVKTHGVEIIHAHMARDYPIAAYAAARNRGASLVITRHVLFPLSSLHKLTMSKVARVIAVSNAVAQQLRTEGIAPKERIVVVNNGVSFQRFEDVAKSFDRRAFLEAWRLPEGSLLVGIVGELKPLKGQEEFLRAASLVAKLVPNSFFIVAGIDSSPDQQYRQHLYQLTSALELKDRVRFINWIEEIGELYCVLDIFVSASQTESFGLAIAEAMACSTAVVATRTEGALEILEHGELGMLVPINDEDALASAVLTLLQNEDKRRVLAKRGAESVRERFSLERMVRETEQIYREIQRT